MRIRQQLADCGFEKYAIDVRSVLTEIFIVDIIVEGCASEELRRRILQKDVTVSEIEEMGSMMEGIEQQVKDLGSLKTGEGASEKVFRVETNRGKKTRPVDIKRNYEASNFVTCYSCGVKGHVSSSKDCKARNQTCRKCNRKGHFEAVCGKRPNRFVENRKWSNGEPKEKKVRLLEEVKIDADAASTIGDADQEAKPSQKSYYCFYLGTKNNNLEFTLGGVSINMLVDSGSDVNLLTALEWEKLKQRDVRVQQMAKGSKDVIKGYGSDMPLQIIGSFVAKVSIGAKAVMAKFFVVNDGQRCLMGDATAKALGVLRIGREVNQLERDTVPFAKIKDVQVQIHMDASVKPVFQPVRRVPIPYEEGSKQEARPVIGPRYH
ncbi:uncharacterized protein LOC129726870 [Wyeomyia smithii]|uniref:uncharacterized protein LOC129726870 n=1 Tax=Wyeomyia smithii TaxID=174621 RepID=UPI002467FE9B|nr:uncharacterized protein LOC129726870 [Wyeomyia smithii]XP_055540022.1 uncharacterized protein LOC129726870 [Wyeomyia smithii]XP_055540023.1 uncharacterized protein LOC129726870 [Wyeomyia smithii]XP_055540024.1 uncharacterized protein LOC129726870 [Wyeomyia smithii]XP_055540025.1 uncharacterized protein LOC129726870 [Wyeomyia smithii]